MNEIPGHGVQAMNARKGHSKMKKRVSSKRERIATKAKRVAIDWVASDAFTDGGYDYI